MKNYWLILVAITIFLCQNTCNPANFLSALLAERDAGDFMDEFYGRKIINRNGINMQAKCFNAMFGEIQKQNGKIEKIKK